MVGIGHWALGGGQQAKKKVQQSFKKALGKASRHCALQHWTFASLAAGLKPALKID